MSKLAEKAIEKAETHIVFVPKWKNSILIDSFWIYNFLSSELLIIRFKTRGLKYSDFVNLRSKIMGGTNQMLGGAKWTPLSCFSGKNFS